MIKNKIVYTATHQKASRIIVTVLMAAFAIGMVIPFIWMLSSSFKTASEVMQLPIKWIPNSFDLRNYKIVWNIGDLAPRDYQFANAYIKLHCCSSHYSREYFINKFSRWLRFCKDGIQRAQYTFPDLFGNYDDSIFCNVDSQIRYF